MLHTVTNYIQYKRNCNVYCGKQLVVARTNVKTNDEVLKVISGLNPHGSSIVIDALNLQ